jgi:hypothetical protein
VPATRASDCDDGRPNTQCLRWTASASPRHTNVIDEPTTIGKLCAAMKASTASRVRGPASSAVIAALLMPASRASPAS